jgi:hypothetical protein
MLFDLQSRGRRTTVKIIYTGLAILMGGGLVLFGIGTGTGGNGFFDLLKNNGPSVSSTISAAQKRAEALVRREPDNAVAWANLARLRFSNAAYDDQKQTFTADGRVQLASATRAWERYLALNPPHPNGDVAGMMARAYGSTGLDQPTNAADAYEIFTQAHPSAATYGQLAQLSYVAGQSRKGDLAAAKAVSLAPKPQQKLVKQQLATIKRQALAQQTQKALRQGAATTPSG